MKRLILKVLVAASYEVHDDPPGAPIPDIDTLEGDVTVARTAIDLSEAEALSLVRHEIDPRDPDGAVFAALVGPEAWRKLFAEALERQDGYGKYALPVLTPQDVEHLRSIVATLRLEDGCPTCERHAAQLTDMAARLGHGMERHL